MSSFPDDPRLTQFLKQHRATVPAPTTDLEYQILTLVARSPHSINSLRTARQRSQRRVLWLVPSAMAAGLVAAIVGQHVLQPTQPSAAEMAELQTFIESTWQGTVADHPPSDAVYPDPLMTEPAVN